MLTVDDLRFVTPTQRHDLLESVCHAVEERLKTLAIQRCNGALSDDAFITAVLEVESRDVTPQGLTLVASHTRDNWIVFNLKMNGTNEYCASFEFLPERGEFRRGTSCNS